MCSLVENGLRIWKRMASKFGEYSLLIWLGVAGRFGEMVCGFGW